MMGQSSSLEIRLPDLVMKAASHETVVPVSTIRDSEPGSVSGFVGPFQSNKFSIDPTGAILSRMRPLLQIEKPLLLPLDLKAFFAPTQVALIGRTPPFDALAGWQPELRSSTYAANREFARNGHQSRWSIVLACLK